MELNQKLCPTNGVPLPDLTRYRQLGALIYLIISWPDINYVHVVSQFVSAPQSMHYAVVSHFTVYVRHYCLFTVFSSSALEFHSYSDALWVVDPRLSVYY